MLEASRQVVLDELKPNQSQLERGLALHYSSYVADVVGCLFVADPSWIWKGDRLGRKLESYRSKLEQEGLEKEEIQQRVVLRWRDMKAFESAFDPQWREDYRNLYRLAGLDLAVEDVGHSEMEPSFRAGLHHVGIPSDLTFLPDAKPQTMDWTNWPYFTVGLVCRGLSDGEIRKIIGGNFLRLAKQVLDKRPWGPFISRGAGYSWVNK